MSELDGIENPFRETIVRDAWSFAQVDVPEINRRAHDACLAAFEQVASGLGSTSVLLHGSTGSGKTHLLSRLQDQLVTGAANAKPGAATRCIFVSVKLQTSAQMLWQHLRRRLADDLLREVLEVTQLQRLVAHYLAKHDPEQKSTSAWERQLRVLATAGEEHANVVDELLDRVAESAELGFDLRRILGHLVFRRHRAEARAWLRGDSLPEDSVARLGLSAPADVDPEDAARDVVLGVCRLSERSLPMVLCFDQVEALQAHTGDTSAFFRLGGMLATLFEADDTLLLLTCVQSSMLGDFREAIREADWVRLARAETTLEPLWPEQAHLLVRRRLEAVPSLAPLRRQHPDHPLWPLLAGDVDAVVDHAATARRVLSHAERLFEALRTEQVRPPREERTFLAEELERRRAHALRSLDPSATEATLRHGLALGLDLAVRGWRVDTRARQPEVLELRSDGGAVSAWILNQDNMTSLAAKLRRMASAPSTTRRVLLRDPRRPIKSTAKQARKYLATLVEQGVTVIEPDVEVMAALEAMRTLLSDARAGDLSNDGAPVQADAVRAWLEGQLGDLELSELFARVVGAVGPTAADMLDHELAAVLLERPVIALDALATAVGRAQVEVEARVRQHPARFGLLSGPPLVVFEHVPAGTSGDEVRS
jgi:hypothetical protein